MRRVLTFADSADPSLYRDRFALLYDGFMTGALMATNRVKDGKTRDTLKKEATIIRALRLVSEPDQQKRTTAGGEGRTLKPGAQTLDLGQPEHELLSKYLGPEFMPWNPEHTVEAVELLEWVDGAEKVEEPAR